MLSADAKTAAISVHKNLNLGERVLLLGKRQPSHRRWILSFTLYSVPMLAISTILSQGSNGFGWILPAVAIVFLVLIARDYYVAELRRVAWYALTDARLLRVERDGVAEISMRDELQKMELAGSLVKLCVEDDGSEGGRRKSRSKRREKDITLCPVQEIPAIVGGMLLNLDETVTITGENQA